LWSSHPHKGLLLLALNLLAALKLLLLPQPR
jgi:hypothetical protein